MAGVQSSFAEASEKLLPKLAGLRLAESTVERTTEAAGLRLAAVQTAGQFFEPPQEWAWHKDADGKTVAYVAVDATGVPQQGREGAKAASRMANVAVIYNPVPDAPQCGARPAAGREPPWQARYVASLERLAEQGANCEVAPGQQIAPSITATRTAADFAAHSAQTVATDPAAAGIFMTDHLNPHRSETRVRSVATAGGLTAD
jgi:hypothetical protein